MAEYVIMVDGKLETYNNYDDIPEQIDHVIKFMPDIIFTPECSNIITGNKNSPNDMPTQIQLKALPLL